MKFDYPGGYVSQDKVITMEVITKKGAESRKFDGKAKEKL
jgi:hypothetical protein